MFEMKTVKLLVITLVALVPSLALTDDTLVTFRGGIGVDPVSTAATPNIVRGVQPAAQLWAIRDLTAEVKVGGRITVDGRGLIFAGGDSVGTALLPGAETASLRVFATLICENVAPFVNRNTNLAGVPLAANGDFRIDDTLSPRPSSPCNTPVLLIRNSANRNWFAAGIQKFDGNEKFDGND